MLSLRRPDDAAIERFRATKIGLPLSYDRGATVLGPCPAGFLPLRGETPLPDGGWDAARAALDGWAMVPPWLSMHGGTAAGAIVVMRIRQFGVWSLNACRVLERIDTPTRYGFIYGTLPGHLERGEEAFLIEREGAAVRYRVQSFSRPAHPLVWLGLPYARWMQRRFIRDSGRALHDAVRGD